MSDLNKLENEIANVESAIQLAEQKIAQTNDNEERGRWWKKEEQLRKEKEQLRKEQEQLREKENLLLKQGSGDSKDDEGDKKGEKKKGCRKRSFAASQLVTVVSDQQEEGELTDDSHRSSLSSLDEEHHLPDNCVAVFAREAGGEMSGGLMMTSGSAGSDKQLVVATAAHGFFQHKGEKICNTANKAKLYHYSLSTTGQQSGTVELPWKKLKLYKSYNGRSNSKDVAVFFLDSNEPPFAGKNLLFLPELRRAVPKKLVGLYLAARGFEMDRNTTKYKTAFSCGAKVQAVDETTPGTAFLEINISRGGYSGLPLVTTKGQVAAIIVSSKKLGQLEDEFDPVVTRIVASCQISDLISLPEDAADVSIIYPKEKEDVKDDTEKQDTNAKQGEEQNQEEHQKKAKTEETKAERKQDVKEVKEKQAGNESEKKTENNE